eukprot:4567740-Amphidinium_carterae.1
MPLLSPCAVSISSIHIDKGTQEPSADHCGPSVHGDQPCTGVYHDDPGLHGRWNPAIPYSAISAYPQVTHLGVRQEASASKIESRDVKGKPG